MNREAAAERASLVRDIEDRTPTDGDALQHGHARLRQLAWSKKNKLKLTTDPLLIGWIQFFFFFFSFLHFGKITALLSSKRLQVCPRGRCCETHCRWFRTWVFLTRVI